jgi:hypothetical protein
VGLMPRTPKTPRLRTLPNLAERAEMIKRLWTAFDGVEGAAKLLNKLRVEQELWENGLLASGDFTTVLSSMAGEYRKLRTQQFERGRIGGGKNLP